MFTFKIGDLVKIRSDANAPGDFIPGKSYKILRHSKFSPYPYIIMSESGTTFGFREDELDMAEAPLNLPAWW
jgi:hypothetical protein